MSGPTEKGPTSVAAPDEPIDQKSSGAKLPDGAPTVKMVADATNTVAHATNSAEEPTPEELAAPGKPNDEQDPEACILWRRDYPGSSVIHLPVHGPECNAHQALAIFYWKADGRSGPRDPRVEPAILKLWSRKRLPLMVLAVQAHPDRIELCFDLVDPAVLAEYQRKLAAVSWAFPWPLTARLLAASDVQLCDEAGLGLRHSAGSAV